MENIGFFDLEKIKEIAKEAGDEIVNYYRSGFDVKIKKNNQSVTQADLASNKILQKELSRFNFPILSEESKDDKSRLKAEYVWIIDPLDGTSDFIDHNGEFCVMIGLVKNGQPILGVVYAPVSQKYYFAKTGEGAYYQENGNIQKMSVSKESDFSKMKILVSRNHLQGTEVALAEKLNLQKNIQGSAGLKLSRLAMGEAEIYINSSNKLCEWDTCAGYVILEEAGGKITNMKGDRITYNQNNIHHKSGFLATNGKRHTEIVDELNDRAIK